MKSLDAKHTKLRLYLAEDDLDHLEDFVEGLRNRRDSLTISAVAVINASNCQRILEIIALRERIHQDIVPMIEDGFHGRFYTMEAVCGSM